MDILERLYEVVLDRKSNPRDDSYVCSLLQQGEDKILKKVGEEAVEVIVAAKGEDRQRVVEEAADVIYHLLVLLADCRIPVDEVWSELAKRRK